MAFLIPDSDTDSYMFAYLSRSLLSLGGSIFTQSIVKHVLTQGDTIIIASLASQSAQGAYALANNYGSLVARLILQPVEESSRNYFGKLLFSVSSTPSRKFVLKAQEDLLMILRSYILLIICIVTVGPTMAPVLLNAIAGSRWTESGAGNVLATYCYYIPLLAINGLAEAFVSSVATKAEVNRQSIWMLAFSAAFAGAAFLFLRVLGLGAKGLVWANALNMLLRICWSHNFIQRYMKRNGASFELTAILPRPFTLAAGVGAYAVLTQLSKSFGDGHVDILKGGFVAIIFLLSL